MGSPRLRRIAAIKAGHTEAVVDEAEIRTLGNSDHKHAETDAKQGKRAHCAIRM